VYKRFFAFGCSFTNYWYPTWADIIAHDLDIEFYNYAAQGIGNVAMHTLMLEADLTHKFNQDDLIIVCWSGWSREDKFLELGWRHGRGNVLSDVFYDKNYILNHWSYENDLIKNYTAIISANRMFNITTQCSMTPFEVYEESGYAKKKENEVLNNSTAKYIKQLYGKYLPNIGGRIFSSNGRMKNAYKVNDPHPDILGHLSMVERLYKDLDLTLSKNTINDVEKYHRLFVKNVSDKYDVYKDVKEIIKQDFRKKQNFRRISR